MRCLWVALIFGGFLPRGAPAQSLKVELDRDSRNPALFSLTLSNPTDRWIRIAGQRTKLPATEWKMRLETKSPSSQSARYILVPWLIVDVTLPRKESILVIHPREATKEVTPGQITEKSTFDFLPGQKFTLPLSLPAPPREVAVRYFDAKNPEKMLLVRWKAPR